MTCSPARAWKPCFPTISRGTPGGRCRPCGRDAMARTASCPRASLGSDTRPPRDRCTRGAWRRPESEPCVDARSPRRKFRRRRVTSGTPPTSVARMWRRPFRVIRDIAGPDLASTGDESTRTGGHREWRRAVLRIARPIAADLRARARTKDRESVLSLPWSGYSTVFSSENQCRRIQWCLGYDRPLTLEYGPYFRIGRTWRSAWIQSVSALLPSAG